MAGAPTHNFLKAILLGVVTILIIGGGVALYFLFDHIVGGLPYETSSAPFREMLYASAIALDISATLLLLVVIWSFYLLRKKDADLSKRQSSFVALAAHELRAPLTSIRWSLSELRTDTAISPETRALVNGIYNRVCTLIDLTGTLMQTASADHGMRAQDLKVMNISPVIADSAARARFVAAVKKINVVVDPAFGSSIVVRGDALRLRIVFDNLISNAIKYSRENTTVSIGFIDGESARTFVVQDQGIGIPKADMKKVFSGFYRARNAKNPNILGSGFGLYMVKKIVDFHGGRITCTSEINKGTTFYVILPSA